MRTTPRTPAATLRGAVAAALCIAAPLLASSVASAHHGWRWAEDENSELSGVIEAVRLGNPHGELTVTADDGATWTVEVGQPWRNERAGLTDDMLTKGVHLTVSGHRSATPGQNLIKAERVTIDGRTFDLYPDRD
jgi:hypothetical protein